MSLKNKIKIKIKFSANREMFYCYSLGKKIINNKETKQTQKNVDEAYRGRRWWMVIK